MVRLTPLLSLLAIVVIATGTDSAKGMDAEALGQGGELGQALRFEGGSNGKMPAHWSGGPKGTIFVDDAITHDGKRAVQIERTAASPQDFSVITKSLPMDFAGKSIELRGFLRTEKVSGFAGLWMSEDGREGTLAFDNMQGQQLRGTTDWREYSVKLPLQTVGQKLNFGFLLVGTGTAWADGLQLLVDDRPIWKAPKIVRVLTVLDRDHEFDAGSKIALSTLTPAQIENLATLCEVWGFLKYYHPKVTSGQLQWDYELFRVMPDILASPDRPAANAVLVRWIDGLGKIGTPARTGGELKQDGLQLRPEIAWIRNEAQLGSELSQRLVAILASGPPGPEQFYLSLVPEVRNPDFSRELGYKQINAPDPGFQLLALFRYWNIIRYWFPYRDLIEENWKGVLAEFIPRVGLARGVDDYQLQLMALIARAHDTHSNLWGSLKVRPPVGDSQLPVVVRFIEHQATVTKILAAGPSATGLQAGDVIEKINGVPVSRLVEDWTPYYADSNEAARLRDIGRTLTKGPAGEVHLLVRRRDGSQEVVATRVPVASLAGIIPRTHDRPGEAFQLLSPEVAYLKLSSIKSAEVKNYIERAKGTKGLIIDIRNYPAEFVVFTLGSKLIDRPVEFVKFSTGDLLHPGAFHFTKPLSLFPQGPHYAGRVVILIDEDSQSQAEYTAMAFRAAPGAIVLGSTTAGADGNVSSIPLPGGLHTMISGIGVFYPDGRPTQRIGIIPDIEVRPTITGIRSGRDEVLEAAIRQILGPQTSSKEIQRLAMARE